jgi:hypothetical protein
MTLKEKFSALIPFYNVNDNNNKSIQCEQIADEFAIEFYKWMIDNIHIFHELSIWNKEHKKYSEKEILEIFKKEKGL